MRLVWSPRAQQDLADIFIYLAKEKQTLAGANAVLDCIELQVLSLQYHPQIGEKSGIELPGWENVRLLKIGKYPYVIPYRFHKNRIELIRVFHQNRDWPRLIK